VKPLKRTERKRFIDSDCALVRVNNERGRAFLRLLMGPKTKKTKQIFFVTLKAVANKEIS